MRAAPPPHTPPASDAAKAPLDFLAELSGGQSRAERRERASQAIDDAFLNIIWVGALPPIPLLGAAFVAYVQTNMIRKICMAHGVPMRKRRALAFSAVTAGGVGAFATQAAARSLRLVPGVGWLAGAPLQIAVNAAGIYAVGRLIDMRLERDGNVGWARLGRDRGFTRAEYQNGLRRAQQQLRDLADHFAKTT